MPSLARSEKEPSAASGIPSRPRCKAIILAAGSDESGSRPPLLARLGDQTILDHVIGNVLQIVAPENIYVVIGPSQAAIQRHRGDRSTYLVQEEPSGTGHAVLQVRQQLADFDGDLLIMYGDTPLFRSGSIRGLLNRHALNAADLTLLTAVVDRPLPYGRIRRGEDGRIRNLVA